MPLVLDASAAVDALLPTRRQEAVLTLLVGQDVYAPQIIDLEVLSALARLERASDVDRREASQALRDWSQFPLTRVDSDLVVADVWKARHSIRISDGFYVAVARGLGFPLLTSDSRLARAPLGDVRVTVVR